MKAVLDRLMISDLSEANDPLFLSIHKVQSILYFGDGGMFPEDLKVYYRHTRMTGRLDDAELRDGVDFLRESLRAGRRVLAVGPTGSTLVAAYLAEVGYSATKARLMIGGDGSPKPDQTLLEAHAAGLEARGSTSPFASPFEPIEVSA